jgi:hypothetical protein
MERMPMAPFLLVDGSGVLAGSGFSLHLSAGRLSPKTEVIAP